MPISKVNHRMTTGIPDDSHADTHAFGGSDFVSPDSIGAASIDKLNSPTVVVPRTRMSGTQYASIGTHQFASTQMTVSPLQLYLAPMFCPSSITIDTLRIKSGGTGPTVNIDCAVGIYSNDFSASLPLNLLASATVQVPIGSTNTLLAQNISVALQRGIYWVAFLNTHATNSVNVASGGPYNRFHEYVGQSWNQGSGISQAMSCFRAVRSVGTLPASLSSYVAEFTDGIPATDSAFRLLTSSPIVYFGYA